MLSETRKEIYKNNNLQKYYHIVVDGRISKQGSVVVQELEINLGLTYCTVVMIRFKKVPNRQICCLTNHNYLLAAYRELSRSLKKNLVSSGAKRVSKQLILMTSQTHSFNYFLLVKAVTKHF